MSLQINLHFYSPELADIRLTLSNPRMKAIKVIKRNAVPSVPRNGGKKHRAARPASVTATVADWITESRKKKVDQDSSSRITLERWASESST